MPDPCLASTSCFDLTVNGSGGLEVAPILRPGDLAQPVPDAGTPNGLLCTDTGLWAPPDWENTLQKLDFPIPAFDGSLWTTLAPTDWPGSETTNMTVVNSSATRHSDSFLVTHAQGYAQVPSGVSFRVILNTSVDNGVTYATPCSFDITNSGDAAGFYGWSVQDLFGGFSVAPGGSFTYRAKMQVARFAGSGGFLYGAIVRTQVATMSKGVS